MKKKNNNINVTKSFLPPMEEYVEYLDKIWDNCKLTNQGPLLKELELKLKSYLGVDYLHFITNGTISLQLALRVLDITEGEIITTPFSYVATTSAILWERCKPVFVDIDAKTFCIDTKKIEKAITKNTKAIMAVHVFGVACDVEEIENIAKKNNLKVIYDAAHAFGVEYKGKSLLGYGDISVCSFHATKLFHTIEGGCLVSKEEKISNKLELIKKFGHHGDDHLCLGINAKASEFQAAMGLCNIKYIDTLIGRRKHIFELYWKLLGDDFKKLEITKDLKYNYAYFPVVFNCEKELLSAVKRMNDKNIFPRRYFFPSLNTLPYLKKRQNCPISEDISSRILCLPLYIELSDKNIGTICRIIKDNKKSL